MSSIITQVQDNAREMCIRSLGVIEAAKTRARDQRGQTAAEYMGILLLIGMIIFALVTTTDIDKQISEAVKGLVTDISKGSDPNAE